MLTEVFINWSFIVGCILIIIAATFNAAMDVISHHYSNSYFSKLNKHQFYDPNISWRNKYINGFPDYGRKYWKIMGIKVIKHVAFTDAWHLFKSSMIVCLIAAIVFYEYHNMMVSFIHFCIFGFIWNFIFMQFYTKYFRK